MYRALTNAAGKSWCAGFDSRYLPVLFPLPVILSSAPSFLLLPPTHPS